MITVKVMVRLDLAKDSLLFNKLVLNVMEMEKLLAKRVRNVEAVEKFKVMNRYL